jgi:hypothetical protein
MLPVPSFVGKNGTCSALYDQPFLAARRDAGVSATHCQGLHGHPSRADIW